MWRTLFEFLFAVGQLFVLPLGFGVFLLLLFLAYCALFAWLELFPIFSGHFRVMSKIWFLGLKIVINKKVWKMVGIGVLFMIIGSIFAY